MKSVPAGQPPPVVCRAKPSALQVAGDVNRNGPVCLEWRGGGFTPCVVLWCASAPWSCRSSRGASPGLRGWAVAVASRSVAASTSNACTNLTCSASHRWGGAPARQSRRSFLSSAARLFAASPQPCAASVVLRGPSVRAVRARETSCSSSSRPIEHPPIDSAVSCYPANPQLAFTCCSSSPGITSRPDCSRAGRRRASWTGQRQRE